MPGARRAIFISAAHDFACLAPNDGASRARPIANDASFVDRDPRLPPADRVLVIRLGALGDVVRTLPAVSTLRSLWPGAHLAWLVEPGSAGAVRQQPWIDEVIVFPRDEIAGAFRSRRAGETLRVLLRSLAKLRERRFDLVLDFHSILKSGLLSFATGAPRRIGYAPPFAREGAHRFATHRVRPEPERISRFDRNLALLQRLGSTALPDPKPFRIDPEAMRRVERALAGSPPAIALHPGTSPRTPHKRWAPERFGRVAMLLREQTGLASRVSCGPDPEERALAAAVVAASEGAATLAPATASLHELAALLANSRLFIGGDTGPLHIASLVGTPVVQLLGPTDPVENEPWRETPSRSVRAGVECSPCRRGCADAQCMQALAVESVVVAARELLGA